MEGIRFIFSKGQTENTSVSEYLNVAKSEKSNTPAYFVRRQVTAFGKQWEALYVSLFFRENPGYKIAPGVTIGNHPGDVEKVVVLLGNEPKVYFSAHGKGQGQWLDWKDCETQDGILNVYLASGSNAMYPYKGRYYRVFGFANDLCDGKGIKKLYNINDLEDAANQTWSSTHHNVAPGVNSPLNVSDPSETSVTPFQRFFLPITNGTLKAQQTITSTPP